MTHTKEVFPGYTGYKLNLLINARHQMKRIGGTVRVRNQRVQIRTKDGRYCEVWYPIEPRVRDLEIDDLKDAVTELSGSRPFMAR